MRQSQSYAMRCTSIFGIICLIFPMLGCRGLDEQSSGQDTHTEFDNPKSLIAALRKNPARTLQTLHTATKGVEQDALILQTIEQFPIEVSLYAPSYQQTSQWNDALD